MVSSLEYYLPPERMCTMHFLKQVLSGNKKLLKANQVKGIPRIPRIPEINARNIWLELKAEPQIAIHFPDTYITQNRVPDRSYMFNVDSLGFRHSRSSCVHENVGSYRKL